MKRVAEKHGLVCLLSEKPFAGINGSGKHVNWSVSTDKGENLFSPGKTPAENTRFLLFLAAFLKGVDEYYELLRSAAAYAGNDNRLGGQEAPPAIISVFIGSELEKVVDSIIEGKTYDGGENASLAIGKDVLLQIGRDNTDRNRTSPLSFTGNKFEFRMVGSSQSIASPVAYLNTILAQELKEAADELEAADDPKEALNGLIRRMLSEHRRIVFNGNGYDEAWVEEAARRGLKNLKNTAQTVSEYASEKNVRLLTENGIYSRKEIESRNEIRVEKYCSVVTIEARTLDQMIRRGIFGAVNAYLASLPQNFYYEKQLYEEVGRMGNDLYAAVGRLESHLAELDGADEEERLSICSDKLTAAMKDCRAVVDKLETVVDSRFWPYPTYTQLLFTI